jgi:formylglycine-generating enzyme required for sulfatase activity
MERLDDAAWEARRLEKVLGAGEVEGFRPRFLAHRGHTQEQIDDILDRENKGPLKRRINELRRRQMAMRRNLPSRGDPAGALPGNLALDLGDGVSMRLLLVRVGEFLMGTAGSPDEVGSEKPQHHVRITRPFYLGEFPVTQAQFAMVLAQYPSRFQGDSDRPVEHVSWFAAQEFCLRLSTVTGRLVRLPSEAEWEYACRAGTTFQYTWGDQVTAEQVNCRFGDPLEAFIHGTAIKDHDLTTNSQGRFPPNAWGFYDMHGNVQEWCEDEWHEDYVGSPPDGAAWVNAGNENPFRSLRGGSCWHFATACTSTARQRMRADINDEPAERPATGPMGALFGGGPPVGFRVVVETS